MRFQPRGSAGIIVAVDTLIFSLAAILLYVTATSWLFFAVPRSTTADRPVSPLALALVAAALLCHASILYQDIVTQQGLNLGLFDAASLLVWVVLALLMVTALTRPIQNLLLLLLPLAAVAVALEVLLPGERLLPTDAPHGLRIHVVLSILAHSLLAVAALQAVVLAFAERQLRHKRLIGVLHWLPSLEVMDRLMFQFIGLGFLMLSLSLVSGLIFLEDIFAQHLAHKTVLGIAAWLIFGTLLWGRQRHGWRGPTAVKWTLAGFLVLLLAYLGSKFVLELILHRV